MIPVYKSRFKENKNENGYIPTSEEDRNRYEHFLYALPQYASQYNNYDSVRLFNLYKRLPKSIKAYIQYKGDYNSLYHGTDELNEQKATSFLKSMKLASVVGKYTIPFSEVKSCSALIDISKVLDVMIQLRIEDFQIDFDTNEVLLLNVEWKDFNIERYIN